MGQIGWDLDAGSSSGNKAEFTKFPVGTTRIVIIDKAPHMRWVHWMPQFKRSVNCPGVKVCPIDDIITKQKANGETLKYNRSRRFAINIFNLETNRVEIMEQGRTFFEDLKLIMSDLAEEGKNLSDVVLKVRRTGTGKDDTKYRIDVQGDFDGKIPEEGVIDLEEYFKPHTVEQINRLLRGEAWDDVMASESKEEDEEYEVK